jgi:hypothetical protein
VAGGVAVVVVAALAIRFWPGGPAAEPLRTGQGAFVMAPVDSGWIAVDSAPPGARTYVGDTKHGDTPLPALKLPAGTHVLELEAAGFEAHRETVVVAADDTTAVFVNLSETTGSLAVTTAPPGATVTLAGDPRTHVAPATITGLPTRSRYDVRAELPGYLPAVRQGIEVPPDSTASLHLVLSPIVHDLTIRSVPDSAEVYWDGRPAGTTPLVLRTIREGSHELGVRLAGYAPYTATLAVTSSAGVHTARLEPLPPGTLQFMISPYAEIWVDGSLVKKNTSNHQVKLPVGAHAIRLLHPAFEPHELSWQLGSGALDTLRFDFPSQGVPID